jgi:hypothetical protein
MDCGDVLASQLGTQTDKCGGIALREGGLYGYHMLPVCLLQQLNEQNNYTNSWNSHSPQLGWAMDGFPIYGPLSRHGIAMLPCGHLLAHPTLCLDACNGFEGLLPGVDEYKYRYYVPAPIDEVSLCLSLYFDC